MAQKKGAARPRSTPEVIDVTPDPPEVALARQEGLSIQTFIEGLRETFTQGVALEKNAHAALDAAKRFTLPTTADQDVTLQSFIKATATGKKQIVANWQITAIVHSFHKRLVAVRSRGEALYDEAAQIATRLHNRYVEDERRRAREEEDRLRREAEARVREARERELAALEEQALQAEASSADLSEREQRFVDQMDAGAFGPTQCARLAGYRDPDKAGARLMALPKIQAAIQAKRHAADLRRQAEAVKALPVDVETVTVKPNIQRAAGASDRTTHGGEVVDAQALIEAVFDGRYGIPRDVLMVNPVKVNEYGRSMRELINRWPGVRYTKKTTVV